MEKYIEGNKAAWEEAFEKRDPLWGTDIVERVRNEEYPFFNEDMKTILGHLDTEGKTVGQFCCNNGRELLSLVKSGNAAKGIGFDIAENQVEFANEKAEELALPCEFVAANIYDINDEYKEQFDVVIITIGALCWFKDLYRFFKIIANCMKPGATIIINEQHPCTPISEIIAGMCSNSIVITGMHEYDYDISGGFTEIDRKGYPLSMIIEGRKEKR